MTFLEEVLAGRKSADDIDDAVEAWHQAGQREPRLHEVLGMSKKEYERWVLNPDALDDVIAARRARGEGTS